MRGCGEEGQPIAFQYLSSQSHTFAVPIVGVPGHLSYSERRDSVLHPGRIFFGNPGSLSTMAISVIPDTKLCFTYAWPAGQVSHLKAACEDTSERTVLFITDETCVFRQLPSGLPPACWPNVVRHYPYNAPRWENIENDA